MAGGGQKKTCAQQGCQFHAVRHNFCLRHCWKANYPDVVPTNSRQWSAALELVSTEQSYGAGLEKALRAYCTRAQAHLDLNDPIISAEDMKKIFHNLEEISKLNKALVADLEDIKGLRSERALLDMVGRGIWSRACSSADVD